jgi:hypothetical protein
MRSPAAILAAAAAVAALAPAVIAGPALAQSAINPGYWETTSKVTSPFPTHKTERRCIKPQDVAKFMEGQINHIYKCTYPKKVVADGRIELAGSCKTRDGDPVPISGSGSFTRETMHVEARIEPKIGGLTVPVHAQTDARRLGDDCPAPEAGG